MALGVYFLDWDVVAEKLEWKHHDREERNQNKSDNANANTHILRDLHSSQ